jgi:hypothetical protein
MSSILSPLGLEIKAPSQQEILQSYEFDRYVTTTENLKSTLSKFGVAIIPNVLNRDEILEMQNGMWDYLEHITQSMAAPIDRNNPQTWRELIDKLFPQNSMLMQSWGIGHAQFLWNLRQNPKILEIMSSFWGVDPDELLVSFDGASFLMPPETTSRGWFRGKKWLHTDQSYLRNDFECVQSWVTAFDVNPGDATLTFLEQSHQFHGEFKSRFFSNPEDSKKKEMKNDWFILQDPAHLGQNFDLYCLVVLLLFSFVKAFYLNEKKCVQKCVKCPAGSMVFWDSRVIHSGQQALKLRSTPNFRCIAYLCYTERSRATETSLKKKRKAFHELRTTSHWPHKPKLFAKRPRHYGRGYPNVTNIEKPVLTKIGKKLAGF